MSAPHVSVPLSIEVTVPVDGKYFLPRHVLRSFWDEDQAVEDVRWRAHRSERGVVIAVTAHAGRLNHSWYRPSPALSPDLPVDPPPIWVPAAPDGFEDVAVQMLGPVTA